MKSTAISIIIVGVLIGGAIYLTKSSTQPNQQTTLTEENLNTNIVDGKQIIEINARGGYSPRIITAKAGMPTIVRFNTNNTFDCSASVRIPSMDIFKLLPNSGETDIDVGIQKTGALLGSCGMGMYRFEIDFK